MLMFVTTLYPLKKSYEQFIEFVLADSCNDW
jgi:hypothetical protein